MSTATEQDAGETPPSVHLHQIAYSEATRSAVEQGFATLDNLSNERPDWYEYWPIRRFLLAEPLDEAAFYGFFSTKFGAKTGLTHADVARFVRAHAGEADVLLFSPQPDMGAFFINVFEQAEVFDPGLIEAYAQFLEEVGRPLPLSGLLMDSRHVVFSNYFAARPSFWREWLRVNEALFTVCEGPDCDLKRRLCAPTSYPGAVERKVFLQERTASLLLATQPWRSRACSPFDTACPLSRLRAHPMDAVISDALKIAFRDHRHPQYLTAYVAIRERFRAGALAEA